MSTFLVTELATMITGPQPTWLPYMEVNKWSCLWTQGGHTCITIKCHFLLQ
jgi:hypothetical protein